MKVLQRIKSDLTLPIWCLAALYFSHSLFLVLHDFPDRTPVDGASVFGAWFILSWWLWHDARTNNFVLPMSYGFLVLLASPIYLPLYLFQTRGGMAFVTIGLYVLILTVPGMCLFLLLQPWP